MRFNLRLFIAAAAVLTFAPLASLQATTYLVETTQDTDLFAVNLECWNEFKGCSLRQAIAGADLSGAGLDVIEVPAGTYPLDYGPIESNSAMEIKGAGAGQTIVDGQHLSAVFYVDAGDMTLRGLTVQNGESDEDGGGILHDSDDDLNIFDCVIRQNRSAGGGGGLAFYGDELKILDTTFERNEALFGGGAFIAGVSYISGSTFTGNEAGDCGAVCHDGGEGVIHATTISGNRAEGKGGGILASADDLKILSSTIVDNWATEGGNIAFSNGGEIQNSIVARSLNGGDCSEGEKATSAGFNLDSDGTCGLNHATDVPSVDPLLGALADNGGPTKTHALLAGSPAIDKGFPKEPMEPAIEPLVYFLGPVSDQRGVERPIGGAYDIGAYEFDPAPVESDVPASPEDSDDSAGGSNGGGAGADSASSSGGCSLIP